MVSLHLLPPVVGQSTVDTFQTEHCTVHPRDVAEVAAHRCPAAAIASHSHASFPKCSGLSSLGQLLDAQEFPSLSTLGEACTVLSDRDRCYLWHHEKHSDGWGSQFLARTKLFMSAMQLGCSYMHSPVVSMKHSNDVSLNEAHSDFFGLAAGCICDSTKPSCDHSRASYRIDAKSRTVQLSFGSDNTTIPLRTGIGVPGLYFHGSHMRKGQADLSQQANPECTIDWERLTRDLTDWRQRHRGAVVACERGHQCIAPQASRCLELRGLAALRSRYRTSVGGTMALPWYKLSIRPGATTVRVAVHIRRGDIFAYYAREKSRGLGQALLRNMYVSNDRIATALAGFASAIDLLRERWRGRPWAVAVHIFSNNRTCFPETAFEMALGGIPLFWHTNVSPAHTMAHMIAADVLFVAPSSFSQQAAMFNTGVKLHFTQDVEPQWRRPPSNHTAPLRDALQSGPFGINVDLAEAAIAVPNSTWFHGEGAGSGGALEPRWQTPTSSDLLLSDPLTRNELLCQLQAHLVWRLGL